MNWLDIVIIVVIAISIFFGLRTGIIKAALFLAGVIVGITLAGHYYVPLSERLSFISQDKVAEIVAFAIILIGVMVIAGVLAKLLKWAASVMMLSWVNHLGGAILGLVLGVLFCGALLTILVKFLGMESTITQSVIATVLLDRFPIVLALLPDEFNAVRSFFQ